MTTDFSFADWPPALSKAEAEELTLRATTYALSHGLLYLPTGTVQPPAPTSAIHAPLSLFPSPFPRRLFVTAQKLQRVYNVLYARIAMDIAFLDRVMGSVEGVGKADEFVGQLWRGWKQIRDESVVQPLHLGLFRSDYLLHTGSGGQPMALKQVEFNTISSSFGPLSERIAALHRHLYATTSYFHVSPYINIESLPPNNTTAGLVDGLAQAHKAYGVPGAFILFVVQPNERNVFDQRWLEYELLESHGIQVVRQTLKELFTSANIRSEDGALLISASALRQANPAEISTVYFRAGYVPTDFPTAEHYATRFLLERSRAIKCPSIPLQLAGGKKVQEALTKPGVLEHFLCNKDDWLGDVFSPEDIEAVRSTWMEMWALDDDDSNDSLTPVAEAGENNPHHEEPAGLRKAREQAPSLVLKPQREGGGNNIYKEDIPEFLDALPARDREAWIAMRLITPPAGTGNYLVRAGGGDSGSVRTEVISELGIFGWALFGDPHGVCQENEAGWLVRTKGKESNEGGVAAGFSVLDSLMLVDGEK